MQTARPNEAIALKILTNRVRPMTKKPDFLDPIYEDSEELIVFDRNRTPIGMAEIIPF